MQAPKKMRYLTSGDYYKIKGGWEIVTADLKNPDYNFLGLFHELIELYLTQRRKMSEPRIKKFDEWFEKEKAKGRFIKYPSPGYHPKAPYRREHLFSVKMEKLLAKELHISRRLYWKADDVALEKVKKGLQKRGIRY